MAYSDFTLDQLLEQFELAIEDVPGLFAGTEAKEANPHLIQTLEQNLDLAIAINTEKARSEMIIAPILLEIRRRYSQNLSLFSGVEFTVDRTQGLNGVCDFILSQSPEQLLIRAPIVTIVEAKNENLKSGFAQCIAAMVGAQLFNTRKQNPIETIYGVVTIGTIWRFIQLQDKKLQVDLKEYYIENLAQILGILCSFCHAGHQH